MDEQTAALVDALHAVASHVPDIARGLEKCMLSTSKQAEFADLLVGLGQLLREHADMPGVRANHDNDHETADAAPDPRI